MITSEIKSLICRRDRSFVETSLWFVDCECVSHECLPVIITPSPCGHACGVWGQGASKKFRSVSDYQLPTSTTTDFKLVSDFCQHHARCTLLLWFLEKHKITNERLHLLPRPLFFQTHLTSLNRRFPGLPIQPLLWRGTRSSN